jgi:hypothetical protein
MVLAGFARLSNRRARAAVGRGTRAIVSGGDDAGETCIDPIRVA